MSESVSYVIKFYIRCVNFVLKYSEVFMPCAKNTLEAFWHMA